MNRIHIMLLLTFLFVAGCATQEPLYYWGNYSQTLYKYKKLSNEENLEAHKACLVNIIEESHKRNKKTPPGVCCEYGYILLKEGKVQEALYYFEMEEKNYPESKVFIDRLEKFMAPSDETKKEGPETTPGQEEKEEILTPSSPPVAAPSSSESTLDPIASGSTLLNPAVPWDAEMIQTRLAKLGLYGGPIDGIWGKGSRAGLKAFKEKNSLENPEKWDKKTQVLLFSGTDQASQTSRGLDKESISSGKILLNPDNAKEAGIIQKRLAELGLYRGPIDGIWGKVSQAGLKVFKEKNSLGNPDKWDKETQKLLFQK